MLGMSQEGAGFLGELRSRGVAGAGIDGRMALVPGRDHFGFEGGRRPRRLQRKYSFGPPFMESMKFRHLFFNVRSDK